MKFFHSIAHYSQFFLKIYSILRRLIRIFITLVKLQQKSPVFIYQMGKVGSTSIYNSLRTYYPGMVFHAHTFHKKHHDSNIRILYNYFKYFGRLKVITLIREPISRNISAFFQNFEEFTGIPFSNSNYTPSELHQIFLDNYKHDIPLVWLDNNICKNFKIDVFQSPFSSEGYKTYKKGNIQLLVIQTSLSDSIKEEVIEKFLKLKEFKISSSNISEEKEYSSIYREFKESLKIPDYYLEKMLSSRYMKHFYSDEIQKSIREKWKS